MSKECTQCQLPSDNKFTNCAPMMADGRNFTDYRPRCVANFPLDNMPASSYEYRQFLIKNASELMKMNKETAYKSNKCGPCMSPYNQGTMLPEKEIMKCNASTCSITKNDPNGIGLGREYGETNNANFLAAKKIEQEMIQNMENCCATREDDMNYYPVDYDNTISNYRSSFPSGGYAMAPNDRK